MTCTIRAVRRTQRKPVNVTKQNKPRSTLFLSRFDGALFYIVITAHANVHEKNAHFCINRALRRAAEATACKLID
jgi:hypothetical protein